MGPQAAPVDSHSTHPVATLVLDAGGAILSANPRAESLLNMASSALVGSAVDRVLRLDDPMLDTSLWQTDKPIAAYDVRIHAGRTAAVHMDVLISPLAEGSGRRIVALHVHGQSQAIGFRRPPSGAMSAIGAAAMLAHEIKNPLAGIRGAAQLLEAETPDTQRHLTRLIIAEVDRIASLIDSMQGFTSDPAASCRAQNIYPLLDRAVDIIEAGIATELSLRRDYDPSLPEAMVDGDRLVQVVINLLKNAAEALNGRPKGQIVVTTAFRHGFSITRAGSRTPVTLPIEIQVMDNGPGVPEAIRDVLFNPFITTKRTGQGLGLALVDKLIRDMGGLVQHERETGGRDGKDWTIFRLLLPKGEKG